jgi:NAD(P)-dependent dehydrogenase (short-subunit alcohol dehydrogenase family)
MTAGGHAIVTGGGGGIGLAIARALALGGYRVTLMGRNRERLEAAQGDMPNALAIACDVGDEASVKIAFAKASEQFGPAALLVNCAGIARTAPFEKTGDDIWAELWRVNVMGAVYTSRAALPGMRTLPAGRIVNIASTASLKAYAYVSAYTSTKHALLGLTRSLALELVGTAITVNAICPGYADTEIIRDSVATIVAKTGRSEQAALATFTRTNPQGRLIDPTEVSATVLWLATDSARSITGQTIVIAGGEIM